LAKDLLRLKFMDFHWIGTYVVRSVEMLLAIKFKACLEGSAME
jgi:hypothetical protein